MLEGKEHNFRCTKVMNMEIKAKNAGPKVLVLGNLSCFCFIDGLTKMWT